MELNTEQAQFIDALYRAMYEKMYTYAAHRLTYSSALAEEAVQEAFRVACTRIDAVMACDNPQGWMLTTLKNVIRNIERSSANYARLVAKLSELAGTVAHDDHAAAELKSLLADEDFILLKRMACSQCSMLETAQELGISVSACRKRITRAKARLKNKLQDF